MNNWRLIVEEARPAPYGLAVDEALIESVSRGGPPTLHLYTFKPAVIIGRFQDVDSEVLVEECRSLGIDINRRTTGGGAILMSGGCLGLAFAVPLASLDIAEGPDAVFTTFGGILADALASLGLDASYRPKNDIEVGGRKIAGIGSNLEHENLLLFHASTLVDFDVDLMLRVLNLPVIKIVDKATASFKERVTTVTRERGQTSMDAVRQAISESFARRFGVEFIREPLNSDELEMVRGLVESKYGRDEWVYLVRAPKRTGQAAFKTPAGLVRVSVAAVKGAISSVLLHGDFFASEQDVFSLECALKWKPLRKASIVAALESVSSPLLERIGPDGLADAIISAGTNHKGGTR